jgi:hypothetical protein
MAQACSLVSCLSGNSLEGWFSWFALFDPPNVFGIEADWSGQVRRTCQLQTHSFLGWVGWLRQTHSKGGVLGWVGWSRQTPSKGGVVGWVQTCADGGLLVDWLRQTCSFLGWVGVAERLRQTRSFLGWVGVAERSRQTCSVLGWVGVAKRSRQPRSFLGWVWVAERLRQTRSYRLPRQSHADGGIRG